MYVYIYTCIYIYINIYTHMWATWGIFRIYCYLSETAIHIFTYKWIKWILRAFLILKTNPLGFIISRSA